MTPLTFPFGKISIVLRTLAFLEIPKFADFDFFP